MVYNVSDTWYLVSGFRTAVNRIASRVSHHACVQCPLARPWPSDSKVAGASHATPCPRHIRLLSPVNHCIWSSGTAGVALFVTASPSKYLRVPRRSHPIRNPPMLPRRTMLSVQSPRRVVPEENANAELNSLTLQAPSRIVMHACKSLEKSHHTVSSS
jgi:hypothetical protein